MTIVTRSRALLAALAALALVVGAWYGASTVQASPAQQGGTTVVISPAEALVTCGEIVPVEIRINNVQGLYGVDVRVTYDPSIVEVVDANPTAPGVQIEPGNFPDVGGSQGMVQVNNVDTAQGTISYAAIRLNPAEPQDGSGVIATIKFGGKTNGTSPVNLAWVMLSDRNARPISAEITNGTVKSSGCGTQPGPTSTPKPGQPTATPIPGGPTSTPVTPPGKECHHVVKPGETLYGIAGMYGTTVDALMKANGLTSSLIYAGQKLVIPGCGTGGPGTPVPPPVYPPKPPAGNCYPYVVVWGDTVSGIAARTGDTTWGISQRNKLVNPNLIFAGQTLTVCPGGIGLARTRRSRCRPSAAGPITR